MANSSAFLSLKFLWARSFRDTLGPEAVASTLDMLVTAVQHHNSAELPSLFVFLHGLTESVCSLLHFNLPQLAFFFHRPVRKLYVAYCFVILFPDWRIWGTLLSPNKWPFVFPKQKWIFCLIFRHHCVEYVRKKNAHLFRRPLSP